MMIRHNKALKRNKQKAVAFYFPLSIIVILYAPILVKVMVMMKSLG